MTGAGLILILLLQLVHASSVPAQPEPGRKHCLWLVEKEGRKGWLLGSMHMMPRGAYPLAREIEEAYQSANRLVFETDIDQMGGAAFLARVFLFGLLPVDQSLQQHLSPATYEALTRRVASLGGSMKVFDRMRPWMCGVTLVTLRFAKAGFDAKYGIDQHFFGRATKDGKPVTTLEKPGDQLDLLIEWDRDGDAFLKRSLREMRQFPRFVFGMYQAWRHGNSDRLEALLNKSLRETPEIRERMLVQRNKRWVGRLETLMTDPDTRYLVVVGAGHLVGQGSVLELLASRGYRVTQQ